MYVVRPVTLKDLDSLESFAKRASIGLTSLPNDRKALEIKIKCSMKSFAGQDPGRDGERFIFVLEDTSTGEIVGTSAVHATSGLSDPIYFYRIEMLHPKSSKVPLPEEIILLHPVTIQDGPSELCGLYLTPEARKEGIGPLLSICRLLFVTNHPERFKDTIMARMRGWIDPKKNSAPFWDGFGSHFAKMSFSQTQVMLVSDHTFIPEILPKYPVYISLLPKNVQNMIGKTYPTTVPALKMLLKEHLLITHDIDVFDGGPTLKGKVSALRTIKKNKVAAISEVTSREIESETYIIASTSLDFRACYGTVEWKDDTVILQKEVAEALRVKQGDLVRFVSM